jgi:hypothetical protein
VSNAAKHRWCSLFYYFSNDDGRGDADETLVDSSGEGGWVGLLKESSNLQKV